MKFKILTSAVFLLPTLSISTTYAETRVTDSQQVCEKRIDGYKKGLEESIKAKQNGDTAKAELDQINKLPTNLSACDKQKRIPARNTDEASKQTNEALEDRQVSPQ